MYDGDRRPGAHSSCGRDRAGVTLITRDRGGDEDARRGEIDHRQVLGEDLLHLVVQRACARLSSGDAICRVISSSIRRSHSVAGVFCARFQKCAPPELNQKSGLTRRIGVGLRHA